MYFGPPRSHYALTTSRDRKRLMYEKRRKKLRAESPGSERESGEADHQRPDVVEIMPPAQSHASRLVALSALVVALCVAPLTADISSSK